MSQAASEDPSNPAPAGANLGAPAAADTLAQLERQVERGGLFTHTIVSEAAERLHTAEALLYGVIDVLIEKELLTQGDISRAADKVRQAMDAQGETLGPGLALRVDGDAPAEAVPVNCAERWPICQAVCCRLHFALTADEIEAGQIKWDLGAPYYIRQEADGRCHHSDPASRHCRIYAQRPGICRQYSCAADTRIWLDFEGQVLNEAWLSAHLGPSRPRLIAAQMRPAPAAALPGETAQV